MDALVRWEFVKAEACNTVANIEALGCRANLLDNTSDFMTELTGELSTGNDECVLSIQAGG